MIPARGWLVVLLSIALLVTICARARACDPPLAAYEFGNDPG